MVKCKKYYDLLGVPPTATDVEIKRAYRLMALKWHPDKNNHSEESTAKFQEITKAYEILFDKEKRTVYDEYGEEGLHELAKTESPTAEDTASVPTYSTKSNDIFSQFFGEGFFQNTHSKDRKGPNINHELFCTLEELYRGKNTRLSLSKSIICPECNGRGGTKVNTCGHCFGRGRVLIQKQAGPIVQRYESTCIACNGYGKLVMQDGLCKTCNGNLKINQTKILRLKVPPGTKAGDTIVFHNEGDQAFGYDPGDVVVTIKEKKHNYFKRKGSDLYRTVKVDLRTALCGGHCSIQHLNGKWLKLLLIPGDIVEQDGLKVVENYGMPKRRDPSVFGNLYVNFIVTFPKVGELTKENFELLSKALPPGPSLNIPEGAEVDEQVVTAFDPSTHSYKKRKRAHDETRSRGGSSPENDGNLYPEGYPQQQCSQQ